MASYYRWRWVETEYAEYIEITNPGGEVLLRMPNAELNPDFSEDLANDLISWLDKRQGYDTD